MEKENSKGAEDAVALEGGPGVTVDQQPEKEKGGEGAGKIRFGSHTFESVEELTRAYEKLEKAVGEKGRQLGELRSMEPERVRPAPGPKRTLDFKKLGDQIIENPEAGVKEIVGYVEETVEEKLKAEREVMAAANAEASREDRIWGQFFERNPWLSHREQEVKVIAYNLLWPNLAKKPQDEQFAIMEDYFKSATQRSADLLEGRELPSKRPLSAVPGSPSGRGSGGGKPSDDSSKPKTFLDSLREKSYVPKSGF